LLFISVIIDIIKDMVGNQKLLISNQSLNLADSLNMLVLIINVNTSIENKIAVSVRSFTVSQIKVLINSKKSADQKASGKAYH
jgi:hypothetical protein